MKGLLKGVPFNMLKGMPNEVRRLFEGHREGSFEANVEGNVE